MNIITCPHCEVRIIPKADGTCPNCRSVILKKKKSTSRSRSEAPRGTISQRDENKTGKHKEVNWGSIDWKKVYAENRPIIWDRWIFIAIILIGFSLYSLISRRSITISLGGFLETTSQYIPIILLVVGNVMAIYRTSEMLGGKRFVIHGEVLDKNIARNGQDMNYSLFINITKEFILNATGKLESRDAMEKLPRNFSVDSSVYRLYNKNDTVTLLFLSSGNFICDLQKYL